MKHVTVRFRDIDEELEVEEVERVEESTLLQDQFEDCQEAKTAIHRSEVHPRFFELVLWEGDEETLTLHPEKKYVWGLEVIDGGKESGIIFTTLAWVLRSDGAIVGHWGQETFTSLARPNAERMLPLEVPDWVKSFDRVDNF